MQKFLSNLNKNYFFVLIIFIQIFFVNPIAVFADLPNGNAVKDPNAILRNSLPIKQLELQDIQHRLEDTSDLVRGGRWPALTKTVTKCQSLFKKYNRSILDKIENENKSIVSDTSLIKGNNLISRLEEGAIKTLMQKNLLVTQFSIKDDFNSYCYLIFYLIFDIYLRSKFEKINFLDQPAVEILKKNTKV